MNKNKFIDKIWHPLMTQCFIYLKSVFMMPKTTNISIKNVDRCFLVHYEVITFY